jgi:hypothetical protein
MGMLPAVLGNIYGIMYFHLGDNKLTGSVPTEVGRISNMLELLLGIRQFLQISVYK